MLLTCYKQTKLLVTVPWYPSRH